MVSPREIAPSPAELLVLSRSISEVGSMACGRMLLRKASGELDAEAGQCTCPGALRVEE
jgi:hypothetical protein